MSNNSKKTTLSEEFDFEGERLTVEEIMKMEAEEEYFERLPLSKYALMWAKYMEEEHPARKAILVLEGIWQETLQEVHEEAREMALTLTYEYCQQHKRPEGDYVAIANYEHKIQSYFDDTILKEIVYKVK